MPARVGEGVDRGYQEVEGEAPVREVREEGKAGGRVLTGVGHIFTRVCTLPTQHEEDSRESIERLYDK